MLPLGWLVLCRSLNLDDRARAPRAPVPEVVRAHGPVGAAVARPAAQALRAEVGQVHLLTAAVARDRVRVVASVDNVRATVPPGHVRAVVEQGSAKAVVPIARHRRDGQVVARQDAPVATQPDGAHVLQVVVMGRARHVPPAAGMVHLERARPVAGMEPPLRVGRPRVVETIVMAPGWAVPLGLGRGHPGRRAVARVVRQVPGRALPGAAATRAPAAIRRVGTTSAARGLLVATVRHRVSDPEVHDRRVTTPVRPLDVGRARTIAVVGAGSQRAGRAPLDGS
jgi:hypothetical protein